jgi:hypothetical protein
VTVVCELLMWNWIRNRASHAREERAANEVVAAPRAAAVSRKYLSLYRYLENRYADVTVLTFSQIEDLLGFALPQLARTDQSWWATGQADVSVAPQTAAWILAGRTATPNLVAKTVVFERTPVVPPRHPS